ncbi:uncharacterized protein TNCV_1653351 [Trichonephila clavipes]|nr:uncharacterized protein TNCV_1653351 [Trichonephila clavipes]
MKVKCRWTRKLVQCSLSSSSEFSHSVSAETPVDEAAQRLHVSHAENMEYALEKTCPVAINCNVTIGFRKIVRVQYFVRGGFVGHRSRVSSKHLSSHLPVDGVRFLGGQKGVALQLQDADRSRCSEK